MCHTCFTTYIHTRTYIHEVIQRTGTRKWYRNRQEHLCCINNCIHADIQHTYMHTYINTWSTHVRGTKPHTCMHEWYVYIHTRTKIHSKCEMHVLFTFRMCERHDHIHAYYHRQIHIHIHACIDWKGNARIIHISECTNGLTTYIHTIDTYAYTYIYCKQHT
jgi:hypothetical protein